MGLREVVTNVSDFQEKCFQEKHFSMKTLEEFNRAVYHGFALRKGYRYGTTENNIPVATSNWQQGNFIFMYFFDAQEEKWDGLWLDLDDIEIVEERK